MAHRLLLLLAVCGALLGACGDDGATDTTADSSDGGQADGPASIGDRTAGPDDYVLVSNVTRGQVVIRADEAQSGLETMEARLRAEDPDGSAGVRCWLVQRGDGTIHQAMRCGPYVEADGQEFWASYPFASDDVAEADGRLVLQYESRLVGEIEPSMSSVDLVRPDGVEAPADAFDDVVAGTGATRPEAPTQCAATGSVTDAAYGTFDLADAEYLEVTASVEDNADGSSYRHLHMLRSWDDDTGRGVVVSVRLSGIPGEEDVESVTVDLDITSRSIMEGGGSGNAGSVNRSDLPAELVTTYDPLTGGTVAVDFEIDGRYSYEDPNPVTADVTISCQP